MARGLRVGGYRVLLGSERSAFTVIPSKSGFDAPSIFSVNLRRGAAKVLLSNISTWTRQFLKIVQNPIERRPLLCRFGLAFLLVLRSQGGPNGRVDPMCLGPHWEGGDDLRGLLIADAPPAY